MQIDPKNVSLCFPESIPSPQKRTWWKKHFIKICFDKKYPVFVCNWQYLRRRLSQCWDEILVATWWRPIEMEFQNFQKQGPRVKTSPGHPHYAVVMSKGARNLVPSRNNFFSCVFIFGWENQSRKPDLCEQIVLSADTPFCLLPNLLSDLNLQVEV